MDMTASPTRVDNFLSNWHRAECWVAVIAFGFIALVLCLDVFGREFLGPALKFFGIYKSTGLYGSQKMSVFALVIASYIGIGVATHTASHLVPRVMFKVVPERYNVQMNQLADAISCFLMLAVAYYGFQLVASSKATGLLAPALDIPIWTVQIAIPLGFLSAALRYFLYALYPASRPLPPEFQE